MPRGVRPVELRRENAGELGPYYNEEEEEKKKKSKERYVS